ncbi:MAG: 23S rRNA (uracil(1939)-C(5))-methyltransferase RlmD [Sphingopyxis sp.]|nr:23S rRNA (uracil(1939)-C(5))-methyltransferase RlmD [Sphingopyxis sp.]
MITSESTSAPAELNEELGGVVFTLGLDSFFQTNTAQAAQMLELVRAGLDLQAGERLLDAYGGVGTFGLPLAQGLKEVVVLEENPAAVADGKRSAEANGLFNADFIQGPVERVLPALDTHFDAAVLDPPRRGCHPAALAALVLLRPQRIAYISCHPGILARDLGPLLQAGYHLRSVQPIDMFPQTPISSVLFCSNSSSI